MPLLFDKVYVSQGSRESLEEQARVARYAAIDKLVTSHWAARKEQEPLVLLAQHSDDQTETVLLQLKRGAGPKGLSGMAENFRSAAGVAYHRPFLAAGVAKSDILAYAQEQHLSWVEDDSNQNRRFDRNFLRKDILPLIRARWPQFDLTLARSAKLCAEQNDLVEQLAQETLDNMVGSAPIMGLPCSVINSLAPALKNAVLRLWSAKFLPRALSQKQLEVICDISATSDDQSSKLETPTHQCRKFKRNLFWVANELVVNEADKAFHVSRDELTKEPLLLNGYILSVDAGVFKLTQCESSHDPSSAYLPMEREAVLSADTKIHIEYGALSQKLSLATNRPSKTLKAWLKEAYVPPWRRLAIPVLKVDAATFLLINPNTDCLKPL